MKPRRFKLVPFCCPSQEPRAALVAALALIFALAAPLRAQVGRSGGAHDHSTALAGGSAIAPKSLAMPATSTATFAGSTRFGGIAFTSTATYTGAVINGLSLISTAAFTAVPSVSFTNLSSSYTYTFNCRAVNATAGGYLKVNFNGSTAGIYYSGGFECRTGGVCADVASTAAAAISVLTTNGGSAAGAQLVWTLTLNPSNRYNLLPGKIDASTDASVPASYYYMSNLSGLYATEAIGPLQSVQFTNSAGNFTGGFCDVWALKATGSH